MVKVFCTRMIMTRRVCFESIGNEISYHKLCRKEPYVCTSLESGGNPDALGYVQLVESDLENLGALETR